MEKKHRCNCSKEFDAEIAYQALNEKYNKLASIVMSHLAKPSAGVSPRSGINNEVIKVFERIVGGVEVQKGEFPECCLIGRRNSTDTYEWFCTGVLVHPRIVLTAAHCYDPATSFVVALNTINQKNLTGAELLNVKRAMPNPKYQETGKFNDISVLILNGSAKTPAVQMATTDEINNATETTLAGFGNNDFLSSKGFGIKRKVDVDIVSIRRDPKENLDDEETEFGYESDLEFVAGGQGYDSCNGDSGGPAYIYVNGERKVAGLTSRATFSAKTPCGEGGIYTRVDAHVDFINSILSPIAAIYV